jgi:ferredoxin
MAKVTFVSDNKSMDVEPGTPLVDVADKTQASIPFSCRNGICGTCLIKIKSGMENLSPKEDKEKTTLELFGATPQNRLACQCKVNGDVEVENL